MSDGKKYNIGAMKAHLSKVGITGYSEGQFAGSLRTMVNNGSINNIRRGVYSIKKKKGGVGLKTCFVVFPIGESESETRGNADKLFKYIIKPVCDACGFEAVRVDKLNDASSITKTIIDYLESAELVIADITEHNPNVFFEMGYRNRTKKPVIHLKRKGESLPFDVTAIRTLDYDLTDLDSVEEVKTRLKKTVESFNYQETAEEPEEEPEESALSDVMPILYQILDSVSDVKNEIKNISTETIGTVIRCMQNNQPPMSQDTAIQMQLVSGMLQNPDSFMKLAELCEKLPKGKKE